MEDEVQADKIKESSVDRKRKMASVVVIDEINAIDGADKIVVATMKDKGWRVVVQKGEFNPGDYAVYFEIDSFLDPNDARYAFLRDRCLRRFVTKSGSVLREGIRIKTIKLRGVLSQGLLLPFSQFVGQGKEITSVSRPPKYGEILDENGNPETKEFVEELAKEGVEVSDLFYIKNKGDGSGSVESNEKVFVGEGSDLTELLKVEHYDEVKEQCAPQCGASPIAADAYGKFPSDYMPKSDEERIQNLVDWIRKYPDRKWEVTAKDDGSSCTMFYSPTVDAENPFGVCSRNLRLKPVTEKGVVPAMWLVAKKYMVEDKLRQIFNEEGKEWAIQGEYVAPGVNKNRDRYTEPEWHVFRIFDIKEQKFVDPKERREFCSLFNLPHVQVIAEEMPVFSVYKDADSILQFAEGKTARGNEREGLVFKTSDGIEPTLSFKAVSNRYLLKQED